MSTGCPWNMHPYADLTKRAFAAFAQEAGEPPLVSLRAGNAIDEYREAPPFDPELDQPTDEYLEANSWGITYLDPKSWRHYLPLLIDYACRAIGDEGNGRVIDELLNSLRPPDREPPRLASLSPEQEAVIGELLEALAFSPASANQELACRVLEEWWCWSR